MSRRRAESAGRAASQTTIQSGGTMPGMSRAVATGLRAMAAAHPVRFDLSMVAALPEPARRWLTHAIQPGTALGNVAELQMHGEIRISRWRPFTASQVLVPDAGFVWAASSCIAGLPVTGSDRYAGGVGAMRWRLCGVVPVQSAAGPHVTRSAAGRLAGEAVLLPTCLVGAEWHPTGRPDTAVVRRRIDGCQFQVEVSVAADGRLRSVALQRWGNPDGRGYRSLPFTVEFDGELRCGGVLVPDGLHARWPDPTTGTGGEFFRASLDSVVIS